MTMSLYKTSVPIIVQFLTSMSSVLHKAGAHCEAKKNRAGNATQHAALSRHVSAGAVVARRNRSRHGQHRPARWRGTPHFSQQ
jgi:hypothetical protein